MQVIKYPEQGLEWASILERPSQSLAEIVPTVQPIINDVYNGGDEALRHYSLKFDKIDIQDFEVSVEEIQSAIALVDEELKQAIDIAYENIYKFHQLQVNEPQVIETTSGVNCWRKNLPIENVGIYIPGGSAPLFSTVLMLAIPAKIVGCKNIILCSPPNQKREIHPAILYAANKCGVTQIFRVGGAQAIAALAFGTESIPSVNKIFGPGNQYVTAAKQLVNNYGVAIDMPAGPSEVLVIGDANANAAFIAADLLAQAEHGADSQVIFLTDNEQKLEEVEQEVLKQIEDLSRKEIILKSLEHSRLILLNDIDECIKFSNQYAPEHLILQTDNADELLDKITNAGSVFIGAYTPESAGDYASGTNHTLPTNGYATAYSGVSVDSFVKKVTFQKITKEGLQNLGKTIEIMAEYEQLTAHKNAVSIRLK
ncbi:MAG: histidinol dehydrogenase [Sphingobacteriales bacterium]|jgi:histidinol dehydrogenase|nr:MAG: histidinol dehydrogenase [Sphingobacteriales bacterium]